MKTIIFTLCSILFSAYINPQFRATAQQPDAVLDIDGNRVQAGIRYYILPLIRGQGGGLTLARTSNKTACPLGVVQEAFEVQRGRTVTFSPVDKQQQVRVSTDQNIKFSGVSSVSCPQSTVWKLDSYDESVGKYFVTGGGVMGNPGPGTISNWFKIEVLGSDYKLVFCPTVCNFCKVICRDIGVFIQDGKRRLALTDDTPFPVFFKRA